MKTKKEKALNRHMNLNLHQQVSKSTNHRGRLSVILTVPVEGVWEEMWGAEPDKVQINNWLTCLWP